MEKIIRSIINYDADNATIKERERMCANVITLSAHLLEKSSKFLPPHYLESYFDEKTIGGAYNGEKIKMNKHIFGSSDCFFNDLSIIMHETCHFAQGFNVDSNKNINLKSSLICHSSHFYNLLYAIILLTKPQIGQLINYLGMEQACNIDPETADYYKYFISFYQLQSFECEADDFSIAGLKYIVDFAKKLNLSDKEKLNLEKFQNNMWKCRDFLKRRKNMCNLRKDKVFLKKVDQSLNVVYNYILNDMTDFSDVINKKKNIKNIQSDSELFSALNFVNLILEIKYDDKLANQIMDILINANQNEERDNLLLHLALWTKIEITDKQKNILSNILKNTKSKYNNLDINSLLKEKTRVIDERNNLINGKQLDNEFIF